MQPHPVGTGVLDGSHGRFRTSGGRHLQQFVERDRGHASGGRHQPWIGGEDAGDVRVELTAVCAEGMGYRHSRRVRPPTPQEGHVVLRRDPLGSSDHRDPSRFQGGPDPVGPDFQDLGVPVVGVGQEAGLATGERLGVDSDVVEGQAQQGHGLAFTGRNEHVHLATRLDGRDLTSKAQQLVGLLAHGRHDEHDLVAAPDGAGDVIGHLAYALRICDRGAAEFLDYEGHGAQRYLRGSGAPGRITDGRSAVSRSTYGPR